MSIAKTITLLTLVVASAWAAIINGQPFFMADTSAYVRGPDFAIVHFLGERFATSWTQAKTLNVHPGPANAAVPSKSNQNVAPLNAPLEQAVLGGRSIYYGALLYLGHITSYFWFSVFLQAAIFVYLSYTFIVTCCRLRFGGFAAVTAVTLLATPASFFVSFLMPDVFASFLILSAVILVIFWDALNPANRSVVGTIALYSVLTHTSHLLLAILLAVTLLVVTTVKSDHISLRLNRVALAVLFLISFVGVVGELAFALATKVIVGAEPMRPPFLMARLIDDGPGYRYLKNNCATKPYVVCNYIDRLPTKSDAFLWSTDPTTGVFNVADPATRRTLSSEQLSFALNVLLSDPAGVVAAAIKDTFDQLFYIGLDEFFDSPSELAGYATNLPSYYSEGMARSHLNANTQLAPIFDTWAAVFYYFSLFALFLIMVFWSNENLRKRFGLLRREKIMAALAFTATAVVFNAAICGALSGPHARYQTRIAWIPMIMVLVSVAKQRVREPAVARQTPTPQVAS